MDFHFMLTWSKKNSTTSLNHIPIKVYAYTKIDISYGFPPCQAVEAPPLMKALKQVASRKQKKKKEPLMVSSP